MNVGDLLFMLNFHDKDMDVKLELIDKNNRKISVKLIQVYDEDDELILSGDIE